MNSVIVTSGFLGFEHLVYQVRNGMSHAGLPVLFAEFAFVTAVGLLIFYSFYYHKPVPLARPLPRKAVLAGTYTSLYSKVCGVIYKFPMMLVVLKLIGVGLFILIIAAGLFGTTIPQRNLATTLTWTVWWSGVVISVLVLGSVWCAVCPWDTLASWITRQKLWEKTRSVYSLNLKVPRVFRNIWIATGLFVILTWLELGWGITTSPYATAVLALFMLFISIAAMVIYERKAFCQYFCPIGRTLGFYSKFSFIGIGSIDKDTCAKCTSLECYYGSEKIESCPTHVTIGHARENTYCVSCGNCVYSCPKQNVTWQQRPLTRDVFDVSKANSSEAWFIIVLLGLSLFHGVTMLPFWENLVNATATGLGDSGRLLITFSLYMALLVLLVAGLYRFAVSISGMFMKTHVSIRHYSLCLLPLAFAYHIAHNLTHLLREARGFGAIVLNPFGVNAQPLSMHEIHLRHTTPLLNDTIIFSLQTILLLAGCWIALSVAQHRVHKVSNNTAPLGAYLPLYTLVVLVTGFSFWLLMQPMIMRH